MKHAWESHTVCLVENCEKVSDELHTYCIHIKQHVLNNTKITSDKLNSHLFVLETQNHKKAVLRQPPMYINGSKLLLQ